MNAGLARAEAYPWGVIEYFYSKKLLLKAVDDLPGRGCGHFCHYAHRYFRSEPQSMNSSPQDLSHVIGDRGRESFVRLNGLRFHYLEWGSPEAEPMLLLHGLRSSGQTFEALAEALRDRYRLIAIDQRGRGLTDWDPGKNYYPKEYVDDLVSFVDFLGLKKFHLLGHSMGGANAILYAGSYPDYLGSLIIEDSGPGASTAGDGARRIRAELEKTPVVFESMEDARAFWRSIRPASTNASIESRIGTSMVLQEDGRVRWRHDQEGIAQSRLNPDLERMPDLWPYVEAVRCPGMVIRGSKSDFLTPEVHQEMARRNSRLSIMEINDAGHYVHDDQPTAFIDAVKSFLDSVPRLFLDA